MNISFLSVTSRKVEQMMRMLTYTNSSNYWRITVSKSLLNTDEHETLLEYSLLFCVKF